MTGIEVNRLLEAVFGSAAITGSLTDHSQQIICGRIEPFLPQMLLAYCHRLGEMPFVGQPDRLIQERNCLGRNGYRSVKKRVNSRHDGGGKSFR